MRMHIPCSGKLSREKTFSNLADLGPIESFLSEHRMSAQPIIICGLQYGSTKVFSMKSACSSFPHKFAPSKISRYTVYANTWRSHALIMSLYKVCGGKTGISRRFLIYRIFNRIYQKIALLPWPHYFSNLRLCCYVQTSCHFCCHSRYVSLCEVVQLLPQAV